MPTKVTKCNCDHKFQDKKYGQKMRVHNYGEKSKVWKCTVCEKTKGG